MEYYIDLIINQLKKYVGDVIKYYYFGDPDLIPSSILENGAIVVVPQSNSIEQESTQKDREDVEITILVLKDMRLDYNQEPQKVGSTKWLCDVVDGRNADGSLKQKTVRNALREFLTSIGVESRMSIQYGTSTRGESEVRACSIIFNLRDQRVQGYEVSC